MELVVDANILFSFFRDNPVRFIILNADSLMLELYSPAYALNELSNNIPDLVKYTGLSPLEVKDIIETLNNHVHIGYLYQEFESEARKIAPHKTDKDVPYFALALKLGCPIWSNELRFKSQSSVKVYNTREVRSFLGV